ncbi:protein-glutamine gamma-glutamyltransferase [Virgibacillus flavescens]|uniref:protein-glutamine gamma-glutamyltransferase n=1 Tax=Virgibacillus flavescens TaxID=1611422 RepID=UPI003D34CB45
MILISGRKIDWETLIKEIPASSAGRDILKLLDTSANVYRYLSFNELKENIVIREHVMNAARKLNASKASFSILRESKANSQYWSITAQGGMRLKQGALPSAAVTDIFENGASYSFECATAMVIVYYYAALQYLGVTAFDRYFNNLYLYSWETDNDLDLKITKEKEPIPGDIVYFVNPDNIEPQWQGENAVFLDNNHYYGHGMGILTKEKMMEELDKLGMSDAQNSYMIPDVVRPSFNHWISLKNGNRSSNHHSKRLLIYENIYHHNMTSISFRYYLLLVAFIYTSDGKTTIYGDLD